MICVVDYGVGNVRAFMNIYNRLGIPVRAATSPEELSQADRIILPGVGAFDWALRRLNESGMRTMLEQLVLEKRLPVLGVCVGMQMMAKRSEEGELPGFGWFDAEVRRFDESQIQSRTHLPHMGWNDIEPTDCKLFSDIPEPRYYFLHSYYWHPISGAHTVATTKYGLSFPSAVANENIFGVQFHPEKSHHCGVKLLRNFTEL